MLRILLLDDHAMVREGLRRILAHELAPDRLGEAATAETALELLAREAWDLLLLDLSLAGRSGLDVLVEVRQRWPDVRVLVVSMHAEREFVLRALKAGASGYITKDQASAELVQAVRKLLAGGRYLSDAVTGHLVEDLTHDRGAAPHEALSPREFEILRALASGRTVSELARDLAISVKTVSTYRARVAEKLGLTSNAELIRYAIEHGLV
ncbi:MAG: response regulator transcription factor [Deltaproteobacteria bacterium]|nr:response regulator transcription factor [Deltaproteobacteria bacterium]